MATSNDETVHKDAVVSQINAQRTREITNLLRHYNSLSRREAANPRVRGMSRDAMHVRAGGLNHELPFVPPLAADAGGGGGWDEAHARIRDMDAVARESLGLGDVVVTAYAAPRPLDRLVLLAVVFYFFSAATLPWLVPATVPWTLLDRGFPGGAATFRWLVKAIFFPVLAIHITECYFFDRTRLIPHGVDRWTGTWLLWETSCFLEGYTAWKRFDAVVAEKRKQKDAKMH